MSENHDRHSLFIELGRFKAGAIGIPAILVLAAILLAALTYGPSLLP